VTIVNELPVSPATSMVSTDYPPQYRVCVKEREPERLSVAREKLLPTEYPSDCSDNSSTKDCGEGVIQPYQMSRPPPDNIPYFAVIAVDNPAVIRCLNFNSISELINIRRFPIRSPVDSIQFNVWNPVQSGNPASQGSLSRTTSADDSNTPHQLPSRWIMRADNDASAKRANGIELRGRGKLPPEGFSIPRSYNLSCISHRIVHPASRARRDCSSREHSEAPCKGSEMGPWWPPHLYKIDRGKIHEEELSICEFYTPHIQSCPPGRGRFIVMIAIASKIAFRIYVTGYLSRPTPRIGLHRVAKRLCKRNPLLQHAQCRRNQYPPFLVISVSFLVRLDNHQAICLSEWLGDMEL